MNGKQNKKFFDMTKVEEGIKKNFNDNFDKEFQNQSRDQQVSTIHNIKNPNKNKDEDRYIITGIPGFDELFEKGIPKRSNVLIAGGAGSGKTIFSLQLLAHHANKGKHCYYMSFEESVEKLIEHMESFGWDAKKLIEKGNIIIKRYIPSDIQYLGDETTSMDAMFAKDEDSQLLELEPISIEDEFTPDIIIVDSITAIASAFIKKEGSYRYYVEQLFRFFENIGSVNFFITETKQIPEVFSETGVEEFLADGIIVFYNIRRESMRERAIEVLKMRNAKHDQNIVAMQITNKGIVVYPDQEVFGGVDK